MRKLLLPVAALGALATPASAADLLDVNPLERHALHREAAEQLDAAQRSARRKVAPVLPRVAIPPQLAAIAECESGGDPRAIGGGGMYRGKYQFSVETWASVGGSGDPAAASEREQDVRAALLYARSGPGQWPVCGQ